MNQKNIQLWKEFDYQPGVYAPNGKKLLLLMCLPLQQLRSFFPDDQYVYVFSYYDPEDYFLDYITYHGTTEEWDFLRQGYTQVILSHKEAYQFSTQNAIHLCVPDSSDHMSFVGGTPKFLQNENYEHLKDYDFVAQISGSDLPDEFANIFYLKDNIGYLFLKQDLSGGVFFVQAT